MNSLVRRAQHILVALTLVAFLTVQAAPVLSSIGDTGGWMTTFRVCGSDTCG